MHQLLKYCMKGNKVCPHRPSQKSDGPQKEFGSSSFPFFWGCLFQPFSAWWIVSLVNYHGFSLLLSLYIYIYLLFFGNNRDILALWTVIQPALFHLHILDYTFSLTLVSLRNPSNSLLHHLFQLEQLAGRFEKPYPDPLNTSHKLSILKQKHHYGVHGT